MKQVYKGHTAGVNAVGVTPDGKNIISGSSDKTLRLWDLDSGECIRIFEGHEEDVKTLAILPDGNSFISGSKDCTLRLWDLSSGECLKIFDDHSDDVNAVVVTPDGKSVVSGSSDCSLRLWDLHTGKCMRTYDEHPACNQMHYLNRLIRSSNYEFAYHDYLVNLAHDVTYDSENCRFFGHADSVRSVTVTPNGKYIISGSNDNTLRLWNLRTGKCLWLFGGRRGGIGTSVRAVLVSPDGSYAISGSSKIQYWKISNKTIKRLIWWIIHERCNRRLRAHKDGVNAMTLTTNGRKIIVASSWEKNLKVYKLWSGRCIQTFTGHEKYINAADVTPDSHFAVTASEDTTLMLWDLKSNKKNEHL